MIPIPEDLFEDLLDYFHIATHAVGSELGDLVRRDRPIYAELSRLRQSD